MKKRTNYLLTIAIDNYQGDWDKLNNAVSDTKAIVKVLTSKYSFELIQEPLYNEEATRDNILRALMHAVEMLIDSDNLIIYFGGHGFMHPLTMKGYWVPFGAKKNVADFIPNSEIKDFIENIQAKHIFLIADACFSGTFLTRTRGNALLELYVSLDDKFSRWMLASGGEETVSDGPVGKSSPFARYLLKFLNENTNKFVSTVEIIRYVSLLTAHYSRQQPKGAYIDNIGHSDGQMVLTLSDNWVITNIEHTNGEPQTEILRQEMRSIYRQKSNLSAGKEILLVDFFDEPDKLLVCECFRFDDDGKQKITYQGNKAKMPAKDDPDSSLTLHARFATWEGFHRFWEENKHLYEDRKPYVFPAVDTIFYQQLKQLHSEFSLRFRIVHYWSDVEKREQPKAYFWTKLFKKTDANAHRINPARLKEILNDLQLKNNINTEFYICGPEELMEMATATIQNFGFSKEVVHKESFYIATKNTPPEAQQAYQIKILLKGKEHHVNVPAGKSILFAGLELGIDLPYSCQSGNCISCAGKCLSGRIEMLATDGLTTEQIESGYILSCIGYPKSGNVVIKFD